MKDLGKLLEAALQEMVDGSVYKYEAKLFKEKIIDGEHIHETFKRFAEEEELHAEIFKEIFESLTGKAPPVSPPKKIPRTPSLKGALRMHLEMELKSIRLYEDILTCPISPRHALFIKGILADENLHLKTIAHYLRRIKP